MMNQQKSRKSSVLKYMLIAPLTLTLVFLSNVETFASSIEQITQNKTVVAPEKTKKASTNSPSKLDEIVVVGYGQQDETKKNELAPPPPPPAKNTDEMAPPPPPPPAPNDQVFEVVEKMPMFPGGDQGLWNFLGTNVRYPIEAQQNGIQGRVICSFIVRSDGAIDSIKILRSVDSSLDKEAVRVIKSMPNWTPGEQRGQKVNVKYTLPVNFRLSDGKSDKRSIDPRDLLLIVIDGVVMEKNFKLSDLKPENIDKIEVLKDASATAVYGEKGKNGVILITMKK